MQCKAVQCNAIKCNAKMYNAMQGKEMFCKKMTPAVLDMTPILGITHTPVQRQSSTTGLQLKTTIKYNKTRGVLTSKHNSRNKILNLVHFS